MMLRALSILLSLGVATLAVEVDIGQAIFNFESTEIANQWPSINVGEMRGRDDGRFKLNHDKTMQSVGTLSLENYSVTDTTDD
ncbi:MAG: hypothetical protein R3C01_17945 [Planctomycetaceae bacterium]